MPSKVRLELTVGETVYKGKRVVAILEQYAIHCKIPVYNGVRPHWQWAIAITKQIQPVIPGNIKLRVIRVRTNRHAIAKRRHGHKNKSRMLIMQVTDPPGVNLAGNR